VRRQITTPPAETTKQIEQAEELERIRGAAVEGSLRGHAEASRLIQGTWKRRQGNMVLDKGVGTSISE
jgi:hypothetical protein